MQQKTRKPEAAQPPTHLNGAKGWAPDPKGTEMSEMMNQFPFLM